MTQNTPPQHETTNAGSQLAADAIILAAGKGTRMTGDLPKVLHRVAGRPMVCWVIDACLKAGVSRCIVVVGYHGDQVQQVVGDQTDCAFVVQHEQLGTGHAARMAKPLFDHTGPRDVFVLPGDAPLIRWQTLTRLIQTHRATGAAATLAVAVLENPNGYGRVIRDEDGSFRAIVEQKDATDPQRKIRQINTGYYCFRSSRLFETLSRVGHDNVQGEYYLTDVPGLMAQAGETVAIVDAVPPEDVMGINTPQQLAQVDQILRARLAGLPADQDQSKESA